MGCADFRGTCVCAIESKVKCSINLWRKKSMSKSIDKIRMNQSKVVNVGDVIEIEKGDTIISRNAIRPGDKGYIVKQNGKIAGTKLELEKGDMIVTGNRPTQRSSMPSRSDDSRSSRFSRCPDSRRDAPRHMLHGHDRVRYGNN